MKLLFVCKRTKGYNMQVLFDWEFKKFIQLKYNQ